MNKLILGIIVLGAIFYYQQELSDWANNKLDGLTSHFPDTEASTLPEQGTSNEGLVTAIEKISESIQTFESSPDLVREDIIDVTEISNERNDTSQPECWALNPSFSRTIKCRCGHLADKDKRQCHQEVRSEFLAAIMEREL